MRKLSVVNRTHEVVFCRLEQPHADASKPDDNMILPAASAILCVASSTRCWLTLTGHNADSANEKLTITPDKLALRVPLALGASWKPIKLERESAWKLYLQKLSKKHYRLLILPHRDMASFLSEIPDSVPLSALTLPGTHDTMAFYGWPISQCQSLVTPLAVQLTSGIRVLDIRLAVKKSRLVAYHGLYPQRASFQEILTIIQAFLTSDDGCEETVVMSIKQEDFAIVPGSVFSDLVHQEIVNGPGGKDMWFLDNRVPLLGEVRGKVIMFSRFGDGEGWEGGLEGMGIHPSIWPDSEKNGFTWDCKNTRVRTHDWYSIPSFLQIPEKTELATRNLLPPPDSDDPPLPTLSISFFSAASFPLAFPPTVARGFGWPSLGFGVEGVNARVARRLMDILSGECKNSRYKQPRVRGWALLDFYEDPEPSIVPLLVECNFWGRVSGEEGWP